MRKRFAALGGGVLAAAVLAGFAGIALPEKVVRPDGQIAMMCPPGTHLVNVFGIPICWPD